MFANFVSFYGVPRGFALWAELLEEDTVDAAGEELAGWERSKKIRLMPMCLEHLCLVSLSHT